MSDSDMPVRQRHSMLGRHAIMATLAIVWWLMMPAFIALGEQVKPCPTYQYVADGATIVDDRLTEISGVAASRSQPGIFWVHNDSGDGAVVYAIDSQGRIVAEVLLAGVNVVDCEDIALGPGPTNRDYLYLADIGDNWRTRESVYVYRFPEPQFAVAEHGQIVQLAVNPDLIEVVYPDGPRDAETLLVDPISGHVVIVSKDPLRARAYLVPMTEDGVVTAEFLVELTWGLITGGDISPDGWLILLRGYWNAQLWHRAVDGAWWTAIATAGCPVPVALEIQGEAIAFTADGTSYLTISEGIHPTIHVHRQLLE